MNDPFAPVAAIIPVRIAAQPTPAVTDVARLHAAPARHDHTGDSACPACLASSDVRGRLFDLLQQARVGTIPAFDTVEIIAADPAERARIADSLTPGRIPALGLRDHVVARSFRLMS